jgi:hypothetical protein
MAGSLQACCDANQHCPPAKLDPAVHRAGDATPPAPGAVAEQRVWFENTSSTCEALRNLAAMRKRSRCLLRCLFGHQQRCVLCRARLYERYATSSTPRMRWPRSRPKSIIGCTAPPTAASKPPTTVRNDCIVEGRCLIWQAIKPSFAFLSSVYHQPY